MRLTFRASSLLNRPKSIGITALSTLSSFVTTITFPLVFCILTIGGQVALLVPFSEADTLSPQRIQQLTDLGVQIADRERALKEAEKQLERPDLTPEERERLTNQAGSDRDFIDTTKGGIEAQGEDQKRVLDRAIEAREKQHQLREARAEAASATSERDRKKAQRTANRLEVELKNDYKDIGALSLLASAADHRSNDSSGLTAAAVLLDPCQREVLLAAVHPYDPSPGVRHNPPRQPLSLHAVRLLETSRPFTFDQRKSEFQLVDDPLPPEAVRELQKHGIDHADQLFEKSQLEKIKSRTPEQQRRLDDLKSRLNDYEAWKNNPFTNKDTVKIVEDTAKARLLQRQAQAFRDSGDPNLVNQANNMDAEARRLMGGKDLPPLRASALEPLQFSSASSGGGSSPPGSAAYASPTTVALGQSGYATLGNSATSTSQRPGYALKGHMTFAATETIKTQTETDITLEPETLAQLEEQDESETTSFPAYFGYNLKLGKWDKPNLTIAARWNDTDRDPPKVAHIDANGNFEISGTDALSKPCVTLHVGYSYDHASIPIDPSQSHQDYNLKFNINFNINNTWVAAYKPGTDINQVQRDYVNAGAIDNALFQWNLWRTPFGDTPTILSGQISDAGYNHVSWSSPHKEFMLYGEWSPGVNPDPMPGLYPTDWPSTEAHSGPVVVLLGSWLKEFTDE